MGLAGPKNRTKLSKDPNNTTWSNNTTRFGHKILTSQGWTPGSTLGAVDAAHADHYTAASSSHIRVLLKEDNLGLGAQRVNAEKFGLDVFQSILGRLNGKSGEVLEKEEEGRRDVNLRLYQTRRFGNMNFISGGFLVGDRIEKLARKDVEAASAAAVGTPVAAVVVEQKRKRAVDDDETGPEPDGGSAQEERKKKRKKEKSDKENGDKKQKKNKRKEVVVVVEEDAQADTGVLSMAVQPIETEQPASEAPMSEKEERRKRKAEKRARKEARRLRKEEKRRKRASKQPEESSSSESDSPDTASAALTPAMSASATPSGTSTPQAFTASNGRHIVRQRYIQQKRMACMDAKALAEIFMIKAQT